MESGIMLPGAGPFNASVLIRTSSLYSYLIKIQTFQFNINIFLCYFMHQTFVHNECQWCFHLTLKQTCVSHSIHQGSHIKLVLFCHLWVFAFINFDFIPSIIETKELYTMLTCNFVIKLVCSHYSLEKLLITKAFDLKSSRFPALFVLSN